MKKPRASEMPRCAPPHTNGAGEEPSHGGRVGIDSALEGFLREQIFDDLRISRELGADFARSWARVSRIVGSHFADAGKLADGFMESGLIGLVKRFRDAGPASQAFS